LDKRALKVQRLHNDTEKHYFFGFHDIPSWNKAGDKHLILRVDNIDTPPTFKDSAEYGYIKNGDFIKCGVTRAFNFPQGSRQQWLGCSDKFIVNNFNEELGVYSEIYDINKRTTEKLNFPCHILDFKANKTFYSDYNRLHHLGGYGYRFFNQENEIKSIFNDGIFVGDLSNNTSKLILSYYDFQKNTNFSLEDDNKQYFTHISLNKEGKTLVFLHRCFLNDGGMTTRLCSLSLDNNNLEILATGYLSHFAWMDNNNILIYGRNNGKIDNLRSSKLTNYHIIRFFLPFLKKIVKKIIPNKKINLNSWLLINKKNSVVIKNLFDEDGHPMFSPKDSKLLINDTYPDSNFRRTLYLHKTTSSSNIIICELQQLKPKIEFPNPFDNCFHGINAEVLKIFGQKQYLHTRSGIHCDFHPRWDQCGKKISFDSNHEGTRAVYQVEL